MASLAGKTVVVIGGSSGIGFSVAKLSLLSSAEHVIIGSSSRARVEDAIRRLQEEVKGKNVSGRITGEVVDAKDSQSVKDFIALAGEIDHLVWTSGDVLKLGQDTDLDNSRDIFDVRFWGAAIAAKAAKIRPGGSVTLTTGSVLERPRKGWALASAITGAVDGFTRGLAVDLAPIRVNVISPGLVITELLDRLPAEAREQLLEDHGKKLLVGHIAGPDEAAEAYLFVMKCGYITGQTIGVDGGAKYA